VSHQQWYDGSANHPPTLLWRHSHATRSACPFNRLRDAFRRPAVRPPEPPDTPCPLILPDLPLPAWVAQDPVVQQYRALLSDLPWATFPERRTDRPWPGPDPDPRAPFVAAFLVKLHEGKRFMSDLRAFLIKHPALVYWLGFERVADPTAPHGFDVAATVPKRRHFSTVLRTLPNEHLQFLLSASVHLLQSTLPLDQQSSFGDIVAGDTQALLAWVKENNPKQFIKEGRLDKTRQPKGDPDCKLGVKKARNAADADGTEPASPTSDAKPASKLQVGVDILWGYGAGIVVTRLPDGTEVVLAERTRPFNESDPSYFFPLMQQVEQRLGRKPRYGAWDCAFDAFYVYEYFHEAGGFAAVPFNTGKRGGRRQFAADGAPLCAAGLAMPRLLTYLDRTSGLIPHERERCGCPLLHPEPTGAVCPIAEAHWEKGGCTTTIATSIGARIRHQLDRESETYKQLYALRTMVERVNSQAEALDSLHPKLRRGSAIANRNTLTYVLINLRALARVRAAATQQRPSSEQLALSA
jgi:hypothetical protein